MWSKNQWCQSTEEKSSRDKRLCLENGTFEIQIVEGCCKGNAEEQGEDEQRCVDTISGDKIRKRRGKGPGGIIYMNAEVQCFMSMIMSRIRGAERETKMSNPKTFKRLHGGGEIDGIVW